MIRMIKVHILGRETKDVDFREAERIVKEIYANPFGALVVNRKTGEVIHKVGPDVEELLIISAMGGG